MAGMKGNVKASFEIALYILDIIEVNHLLSVHSEEHILR
jgi:hypothetical protein